MTEQDEIRRLKELIAKQQLQLAEKDEIIRKQNIRIENMTQALLHAKKKIFGRSSEMTAPMDRCSCSSQRRSWRKSCCRSSMQSRFPHISGR